MRIHEGHGCNIRKRRALTHSTHSKKIPWHSMCCFTSVFDSTREVSQFLTISRCDRVSRFLAPLLAPIRSSWLSPPFAFPKMGTQVSLLQKCLPPFPRTLSSLIWSHVNYIKGVNTNSIMHERNQSPANIINSIWARGVWMFLKLLQQSMPPSAQAHLYGQKHR